MYNTRTKAHVTNNIPSSLNLPPREDQPTSALEKSSSKKANGYNGQGSIEYRFFENPKNTKANISILEFLNFYIVQNNLFKIVAFGNPKNTKTE